MEYYQHMAELCMYIAPVFVILSVLFGLGYNHYTNKVKELKEKSLETIQNQQKGAIIDYSSNRVGFYRIKWDKNSFDGSIGLMVLYMNIVNTSKESITIKDVLLEYNLNGSHYSERSLNLITGNCVNKHNGNKYPSIFVKNKSNNDTAFFMGWYNIGEQIAKGMLLQHGAILQGSAFYLLHTNNPLNLYKLKDLSITITDFLGNKNTIPIELSKNGPLFNNHVELIQEYFENISE